MNAPLRPLSLGEIIDRGVALWRAHWRPLLELQVGFSLFGFAVVKAWSVVGLALYPDLLHLTAPKLTQLFQADVGNLLQQVALASACGVLAFSLASLSSTMGSVATARYLTPRLWGPGPTVREAFGFAAGRLGGTAALVALALAWSAVVGAALLIPMGALFAAAVVATAAWAKGVLLVLGSVWALGAGLGLMLWFVLRFSLVAAVLAAEPELSALGVFRRSGVLISGSVAPGLAGWVKARLTLIITVLGLVLFVISIVTSAPAVAVQAIYGNAFDPAHATPEAVPQLLLVPAQLLQVAASSIFTGVYLAPLLVFYVDMRVRREGFDFAVQLGAP